MSVAEVNRGMASLAALHLDTHREATRPAEPIQSPESSLPFTRRL
jgi:hypothetical protein